MAISRRKFVTNSTTALAGIALGKSALGDTVLNDVGNGALPIVVSTWKHGLAANRAAWAILSEGGYALDAVEAGVRVPEGDPLVTSVGYGGIPDQTGKVSLDACIMDEKGQAGSVCFLQHIKHPISVARLVMENTPHVMLSGKGALKFALANGFKKENLLTPEMKKKWKEWKKKQEARDIINFENRSKDDHDTIGMLALDAEGRLCGACTTSGVPYKMFGRVGDSPIIGAGLFVDGQVGGAVATGQGELVMKTLGSFLVVEFMRNGYSPKEACLKAIQRITKQIPDYQKYQVGYIALNSKGEYGAFSIYPGFDYAIKTNEDDKLKEAESFRKLL